MARRIGKITIRVWMRELKTQKSQMGGDIKLRSD